MIVLLFVNLNFQVDLFHLQNSYPNSHWKDDYNKNKKVIFKTDLDVLNYAVFDGSLNFAVCYNFMLNTLDCCFSVPNGTMSF